MDAELAVGVLKEKRRATIGLVGRSFIPVTFYEYLRKHLPGYTFVDMTDPIDQLKAIKSPEEIALIRADGQTPGSGHGTSARGHQAGDEGFRGPRGGPVFVPSSRAASGSSSSWGQDLRGSPPGGSSAAFRTGSSGRETRFPSSSRSTAPGGTIPNSAGSFRWASLRRLCGMPSAPSWKRRP